MVVFGETPAMHGRMINTRKFVIGSSFTEELKGTPAQEFIKITVALLQPTLMRISRRPEKSQVLFSVRFDRRRTNPLVYLKFWK